LIACCRWPRLTEHEEAEVSIHPLKDFFERMAARSVG
jgi:hypothetical protein